MGYGSGIEASRKEEGVAGRSFWRKLFQLQSYVCVMVPVLAEALIGVTPLSGHHQHTLSRPSIHLVPFSIYM